jgi:hypothetical protein
VNQQNDNPVITLAPMPLSLVNIIIAGLNELPSKISRRLLDHIEGQTKKQLEPPTTPAAAADAVAEDLKAKASAQPAPAVHLPEAPAASAPPAEPAA